METVGPLVREGLICIFDTEVFAPGS
jgi:hypothetical protein